MSELPDTPWGHQQKAKLERLKEKQAAAPSKKKAKKKKAGTSTTE